MLDANRFAIGKREPRETSTIWLLLFAAMLLLALAMPARAQRLPLPPDEQRSVNDAIDSGVRFLKAKQQKRGTWAPLGFPEYHVGYGALPGLTLLECGVPPDDPIIQNTAKYLRSKKSTLATTYELALSILFFDRLGDPKDKEIIQTFALRLIAGQSATGGWGYKCPLLAPMMQKDLLKALHHLEAAEKMPAIARKEKDAMPGIAKEKKADALKRIARNKEGALRGTAATSSGSPLSKTTREPSRSESLHPEASTGTPPLAETDAGKKKSKPDDKNPKNAPAKKDAAGAEAKAATPKDYLIPERLLVLPVLQHPNQHILVDPRGRRMQEFLSTTDNSNTQFAILALWAAQRYDVPMQRTLRMIVRRYLTSQNRDGSWGYDYHFGGGMDREPHPAMTCVGLIGLAVGYGLADAEQEPAGKLVQDPRILNGLVAMSQNIGKPSPALLGLPMQNLYLLWSIERVAVLYKMPMIGDKDWYRWGAQILVSNQQLGGNWIGGGYHGSSPILDTCLALLFLKQANLVKDLTAKLPFNPDDLNQSIMEKISPKNTASQPEPELKTPPKTTEPEEEKPTASAAPPKAATPIEDAPPAPASGIGRKVGVVLAIVFFLLLAGGSAYFFFAAAQRKKNQASEAPPKRPRPSSKRRPDH